jgi:hypothetical protein
VAPAPSAPTTAPLLASARELLRTRSPRHLALDSGLPRGVERCSRSPSPSTTRRCPWARSDPTPAPVSRGVRRLVVVPVGPKAFRDPVRGGREHCPCSNPASPRERCGLGRSPLLTAPVGVRSIGQSFLVCSHTERLNQAGFCPLALREISLLTEPALVHLRRLQRIRTPFTVNCCARATKIGTTIPKTVTRAQNYDPSPKRYWYAQNHTIQGVYTLFIQQGFRLRGVQPLSHTLQLLNKDLSIH